MTADVTIGVHVHAEPARLAATLASLDRATAVPYRLVLLPDGPDAATAAAVTATGLPASGTDRPAGPPACFNRLVATCDSAVTVLLESGCVVGERAVDKLVAALLADPARGLAGPSTNRAWNEQAAFPGTQDRPAAIAHAVRRAAESGTEVRPLAPLHSVSDFCLAAHRDVIEAVGAADEGFGLGPCWEMEYSARAAAAGFAAVWVLGAYVHRAPFTARRRREEPARFDASRRRYQDAVCGLRLRGLRAADEYEPHCRGDECEHFAPRELIRVRVPLPTVRPPSRPAPAHRPLATARPAEGLVSCVMPTRDRARFAEQSVRYFLRQDHPARELIILDDGSDDLRQRLPPDPRIRYERVPRGESIGAKRNRGCRLARGAVIAQWDDDDWYAADRLSVQAAPLLADRADLTGFGDPLFWDLPGRRAWRASAALLSRMFRPVPVHGGTLVFRRAVWDRLAKYPASSLAEDAAFLQAALRRGARLSTLPAGDHYVYLRHDTNSWSFRPGEFLDPAGWRQVPEPVLPDADAGFYRTPADGPLVSCVMPTRDRRGFVEQALRCFHRQTYAVREMIVVDDGREPVADLIPDDPRIRYQRIDRPLTLGDKRNICNELARGEFVAHFDDDDWSAPDRLIRQVGALERGGADLCGLGDQLYWEPHSDRAWRYRYPPERRTWVAGNTLCYRIDRWRRHPFPSVQTGEDTRFVWAAGSAAPALIPADLHVGVIHPGNTSRKQTSGAYWRPAAVTLVHELLGDDVAGYRRAGAPP